MIRVHEEVLLAVSWASIQCRLARITVPRPAPLVWLRYDDVQVGKRNLQATTTLLHTSLLTLSFALLEDAIRVSGAGTAVWTGRFF